MVVCTDYKYLVKADVLPYLFEILRTATAGIKTSITYNGKDLIPLNGDITSSILL